jgi:hypothetical protein
MQRNGVNTRSNQLQRSLRKMGGFRPRPRSVAAVRNNAGMADIPFVDTHFHLHDIKRAELRYSWLEPDTIHGFLGDIDALRARRYVHHIGVSVAYLKINDGVTLVAFQCPKAARGVAA